MRILQVVVSRRVTSRSIFLFIDIEVIQKFSSLSLSLSISYSSENRTKKYAYEIKEKLETRRRNSVIHFLLCCYNKTEKIENDTIRTYNERFSLFFIVPTVYRKRRIYRRASNKRV